MTAFGLTAFPFDNVLLWCIMLAVNFTVVLAVYRFFGRNALYVWMAIAVIIANIQVVKMVEIFGLTASLGNIVYATSFLATDILSENHGKQHARHAVWFGFIALASLTALMVLALLFEPAAVDSAHGGMAILFAPMPRIALASFAAYGASQMHDVWIYARMKRQRPAKRWIWLRNNISTMLSQAIDTFIFVVIAFAGRLPMKEFFETALTTYVLKWVVAAADTPLIYVAARWKRTGKIRELE